VAVIISTRNTVDFCFLSAAMKTLPHLAWLRKGTPVPTATLTSRFNANSQRVRAGERDADETDVMDWLSGTRSARVTEEVVGLGQYGKTLTILSSGSMGHEETGPDDEEDEDHIREQWTLRFRK
jgi:hypothetical protein